MAAFQWFPPAPKIAKTVVRIDGVRTLVTYYRGGEGEEGVEVYTGENYVIGSRQRSYSRNYPKMKGMPHKYDDVVAELIVAHQNHKPWRKGFFD